MIIFQSIKELQDNVELHKKSGKTLGFVPTMGALHDGHLSLIEQAKSDCDHVIVSIFVNPKQFNNSNDLTNYPRTIEKDIALLEGINCDFLFSPKENEIYPEDEDESFDFGLLSTSLEAKGRPGHFDGVANVVRRLFNIVHADKAYFGEKDFQQLAIVRDLSKIMETAPEIVACPIVREKSGLAMSSRNMLLSKEELEEASILSKVLNNIHVLETNMSPPQVCQASIAEIQNNSSLIVDYFEIADARTFEPLLSWDDSEEPVALLAACLGKVRLLDNKQLGHFYKDKNQNIAAKNSQVKIV